MTNLEGFVERETFMVIQYARTDEYTLLDWGSEMGGAFSNLASAGGS